MYMKCLLNPSMWKSWGKCGWIVASISTDTSSAVSKVLGTPLFEASSSPPPYCFILGLYSMNSIFHSILFLCLKTSDYPGKAWMTYDRFLSDHLQEDADSSKSP
ncbi:hypothetical protein F2Q69_00022135 [Brassica cretica]|uniref:Uncharacterized protein n=1 Tax=Brassica cretica TaxID=69181 RepID=A0A8S9QHM3_BRACR|nr:hypothetical protein F2Q69_00022135 [Brassica cretica]